MLKKEITFVDFDGNTQTETHYFNFSASELAKTEMGDSDQSLYSRIQTIIASNNNAQIIGLFEEVISDSYGVRSEDGKRFIKSKQASEEFLQTPAYDTMFMEMLTDVNAAVEFMNGIMPVTVTSNPEFQKAMDIGKADVSKITEEHWNTPKVDISINPEEMSVEQLQQALAKRMATEL